MSLRWDDAGLMRLIDLLADANSSLPSIIAEKLVPAVNKASRNTFVREADVYGNDWAELKKPRKSPKKLAGLKGHIELAAVNKSITGTSDKEYTGYHQTGTKKMPARPPLPYKNEIPPAMEGDLKKAVDKALSMYFTRTGGQIVS